MTPRCGASLALWLCVTVPTPVAGQGSVLLDPATSMHSPGVSALSSASYASQVNGTSIGSERARLGGRHPLAIARWQPLIAAASARFAIPSDWIAQVMRAESAGLTMLDGRPITSPKGAMGLMQLMPSTWAEMRRRHGLGDDPHDPRDNILAGTAYLRAMYDRFGYPGLFGAYNAGPGRFGAWQAGQRALPAETRAYLAAVVDRPSKIAPGLATAGETGPTLFVVHRTESSKRMAASEPQSTLFAIAPTR